MQVEDEVKVEKNFVLILNLDLNLYDIFSPPQYRDHSLLHH